RRYFYHLDTRLFQGFDVSGFSVSEQAIAKFCLQPQPGFIKHRPVWTAAFLMESSPLLGGGHHTRSAPRNQLLERTPTFAHVYLGLFAKLFTGESIDILNAVGGSR
ncbi:MAG: hypothetical protein ACPG77_10670, partial [Nannocystaceae bacterium]